MRIMKNKKMQKMSKATRSSLITYGIVIAIFIIMQAMVSMNMMSSLMKGLLVPLCIYSVVAIGLNLCVGYLGELSLGHAGLCVWELLPVLSLQNIWSIHP